MFLSRFIVPPSMTLLTLFSLALSTAMAAELPSSSSAQMSKPNPITARPLNEWLRDLNDTDPSIRDGAVRAMVFFGREGRAALPQLLRILREDSDTGLRSNAAITIGLIGADDRDIPTTVPVLVKALTDHQSIVRYQVATALGRWGTHASSAIPALVTASHDQASWELRKAAVYALSMAGHHGNKPADTRAVSSVVDALNDASHQVRAEAITALITLGAPTQREAKVKAERALLRVIDSPYKIPALWARVALMRIDGVSALQLEPVARGLADEDTGVRMQSARALGVIGQKAKERIPDLSRAAEQDREMSVALTAIWALAQMGDDAREPLNRLTTHHYEEVRKTATAVLESMSKVKSGKKE